MLLGARVSARRQLVRAADKALAVSPAQIVAAAHHRNSLRVLAYHGIDDPRRFEKHLVHLTRHFNLVSVQEVVAAQQQSSALPPRSVLITFDDGEVSLLRHGVPLLRRFGVPAVAFVVAGLIDTCQAFWWHEVERRVLAGGTTNLVRSDQPTTVIAALKMVPDSDRRSAIEELRNSSSGTLVEQRQLRSVDLHELEASGVTIGNHSFTHPCLNRCSDAAVVAEIGRAHEFLHSVLGRPPEIFAYPNGDFDERVMAALRFRGYRLGFLFDHRLATWPVDDALRVSRIRVDSTTSIDRLRGLLSGLHPAVHRVRGRR